MPEAVIIMRGELLVAPEFAAEVWRVLELEPVEDGASFALVLDEAAAVMEPRRDPALARAGAA